MVEETVDAASLESTFQPLLLNFSFSLALASLAVIPALCSAIRSEKVLTCSTGAAGVIVDLEDLGANGLSFVMLCRALEVLEVNCGFRGGSAMRFVIPGARFSDISLALKPLSIPNKTLDGDCGGFVSDIGIIFFRGDGETGT